MKKKGDGQLSLFHLTWPIFLEVFLFMLMGLADTFMLSALSDDAVSGVGAANQYIHIAILILEVVGNGAAIVVSQYLGSRRYFEAARISALAVTMNLAVGLIMSMVFFFGSSHVMTMMNLKGEVLVHAQSYLVIIGSFIFLQAIINALAAVIRVHGWTKQTMYVSLGMNILHVVLNYGLIFGNLGLPELGVQGAAISSVISRALAVLVFFWLLYQVMEVHLKLEYYFTYSKEYVRKILNIGLPSAFEQVLYQFCQIVFLYYATYLGAEALAARQYAMNISMFTYLFAMAIGMGTAIIIGRFVGAGKKEEAYQQLWLSVRAAFIFTITMVIVVMIFRKPLMGMFTDNLEVIKIGASVLALSILLETGRTMNIVVINSLRASGDARFPVKIGFLSMVCMSLPLGYFFVFVLDWGLIGIWLAISADEWVRAIIVYFRWKSRKWERYALVPSTEQKEAK
ncbi:multidrug transporter MatE [Lysinibacillus contaminans]|uniref:Multidrug transporter MatE n=1 Tax=Lysinibacillus contaminans TaxID=1293441 RepID=A0ABR5JXT6_9BACI|nr:multidrug transporter MatE [Lysinibacillus contaminans]